MPDGTKDSVLGVTCNSVLGVRSRLVFVCKANNINCIVEELGFNSTSDTQLKLTALFHLKAYVSFEFFNIPNNHNQIKLSYRYWILKLPKKSHFKQRYVAGSMECFIKPLYLSINMNRNKRETSSVLCNIVSKKRCKSDENTKKF